MKEYNKELAAAFNEIADLLGIKGEGFFTLRAYREEIADSIFVADPVVSGD